MGGAFFSSELATHCAAFTVADALVFGGADVRRISVGRRKDFDLSVLDPLSLDRCFLRAPLSLLSRRRGWKKGLGSYLSVLLFFVGRFFFAVSPRDVAMVAGGSFVDCVWSSDSSCH